MGPTACGKSALAVGIAQQLGDVEIVSADSMQVYRGMDIGTAKPRPDEMRGVPHHLVDVVGPEEQWDVARFVAGARGAIEAVEGRGHRPMFVGGTGLYVQALVDGFAVPGRWPDVSAELEESSTERLFSWLAQVDPAGAAKIDPGNRRRVLRALEVSVGSGRPFSSYGPGVGTFPATKWSLAGVWLPRPVVAERVAKRLDAMFRNGFLDEVRSLAEKRLSRTARQALGYRELLAHIEDGVPLAEATDAALRRTRQFARRQRMWWRRDPRVSWFGAVENPLELLPALLGNWAPNV